MDKFLPVLLVIFGIIGMIDVSSGLTCFQCMQAPGQNNTFNYGGCDSTTVEPPADGNLDCTGEHSPAANTGKQAVKDYDSEVDLDKHLGTFTEGGTPTCVLAYGTYDGKQYIVRDCAKLNGMILGKCYPLKSIALKDKEITEVMVCGCNVNGCNGKEETAKLTSTAAPTEPPTTTLKELTSDNNNSDDTTRIQFSPITWILAASFFIYIKMVVN